MNTKILLGLMLFFIVAVNTASASCEQSRVNKYWKKHAEAKKNLMQL